MKKESIMSFQTRQLKKSITMFIICIDYVVTNLQRVVCSNPFFEKNVLLHNSPRLGVFLERKPCPGYLFQGCAKHRSVCDRSVGDGRKHTAHHWYLLSRRREGGVYNRSSNTDLEKIGLAMGG